MQVKPWEAELSQNLTLVIQELEKDAGLSTGLNLGDPVSILAMSRATVHVDRIAALVTNLFICIIWVSWLFHNNNNRLRD